MNDHVAVLREMREHRTRITADVAATGSNWKQAVNTQVSALAHAIATCEQHAALVARLGELPKFTPMAGCMVADRGGEWISADDLARVVKEVGE